MWPIVSAVTLNTACLPVILANPAPSGSPFGVCTCWFCRSGLIYLSFLLCFALHASFVSSASCRTCQFWRSSLMACQFCRSGGQFRFVCINLKELRPIHRPFWIAWCYICSISAHRFGHFLLFVALMLDYPLILFEHPSLWKHKTWKTFKTIVFERILSSIPVE